MFCRKYGPGDFDQQDRHDLPGRCPEDITWSGCVPLTARWRLGQTALKAELERTTG